MERQRGGLLSFISRLLAFISRWPIRDRRGLLQSCERLLYGQQDSRLEGAHCAAGADRDRRSCNGDVIRSLPQVVSVVIAKGIPKTVYLSANRFDVLLGCRSAVLGILDELRPGCWRVTESGQVERHGLPPSLSSRRRQKCSGSKNVPSMRFARLRRKI